MDKLSCVAVSPMHSDQEIVMVEFNRILTADELKFFEEVCHRSAPLMDQSVIDDLKSGD